MYNSLSKIYRYAKRLILYHPPDAAKPFVLAEGLDDGKGSETDPLKPLQGAAEELKSLLAQAQTLQAVMGEAQSALKEANIDKDTAQKLSVKLQELQKRQRELSPITLSYAAEGRSETAPVSASLEQNERYLSELYGLPENKDLILRKFDIRATPPVKCMLTYIDGMADKHVINGSILASLMVLADTSPIRNSQDVLQSLIAEYITNQEVKEVLDYQAIRDTINSGDSVLFIEGQHAAIAISTKGFPSRSPGKPTIEQSIRGAQVAFSEGIRINTGLIRSMMQTNELVTEMVTVGQRAKLKCAIMYMKSIANPALVAEVKRRINGITTDYVFDIGVLEQFIEDHPGIPFPQTLSTERPDRVTAHLTEGRIALILDGSPFAHILPVNFFTFFHSAEDFSLKVPIGNFMRVLRLFAALLAVMLPAMYLAINYYHQEALPTELALAIAGARENVPFPALFEILLMEVSFELIREAGTRIPGLLGSTIGIVGALILGQAAVSANIVSPIMVIIIAITGLASFAIPDFRIGFALRIVRFGFLIMSALLGLVGLAFAFVTLTTLLASMKSFGVPYLAPITPKVMPGLDVVVRGYVFRQEERPDELQTIDWIRQPHISRKWRKEKPGDET